MTSPDMYANMHRLAAAFADRPDIVQGAGGNISVKIDADVMLIKASGKEFRDIDSQGLGLVPISYTKLAQYLLSPKQEGSDEATHLEAVRSATQKTDDANRASIEVWFHTCLRTYVLHTHSAYVNILACSEEGSKMFRTAAAAQGISCAVFPFYNPGFDLGKAVATYLAHGAAIPSVILLENHGIIVTADSAEECITLHQWMEDEIKKLIPLDGIVFSTDALDGNALEDFNSLVLFPDQLVFPEHSAIRGAHRFIVEHCRKNGLTIRAIREHDAAVIRNMESEKHRKNIQKI